MNEKDNHLLTVELSEEQNGNMLDGILNNLPPSPLPKGPEKKELDRVKEPPAHKEPGTGGTLTARRKRDRHLHVMVTADELTQIQRRMAEAGITNAGAYMRKMALNGYILHVDLAPVKELVSLQRRCANNLNQVAVHANMYGVYPEEIAGLQRDYETLWGQVSDVLKELSELVAK